MVIYITICFYYSSSGWEKRSTSSKKKPLATSTQSVVWLVTSLMPLANDLSLLGRADQIGRSLKKKKKKKKQKG